MVRKQFLGRLASLYLVFNTSFKFTWKKNTIRIIMTRMYNFFQSLNVIDKSIIIFIHSWLVSMVTEFIK